MRIAAIDIGTNTLRILVCEQEGEKLRNIHIERAITRLGGGFSTKGKWISPDAIKRSLDALLSFAQIIARFRVERVKAVATSVVRESLNGQEFLDLVAKETGISTELISGDEETRLTVGGVLKSVPEASRTCLIFDIGGGSTEYAYVEGGTILGHCSTSLGVVHLAESFCDDDVTAASDIMELARHIDDVLGSRLSWVTTLPKADFSLIGTAGTPTTLAAMELGMREYDPLLVNGFILTREAVSKIFHALIKIPKQRRLELPGLERGREDVIVPGALLVLKTMERFSKDIVLVSDGGLLEGVAYSLIS